MTVRRKVATVDQSDKLEIVRWGLGTNTFRTALLVLVLSMHPLGRGILSVAGFKFPDEQKVATAVEQTSTANNEIKSIAKDMGELRVDLSKMKEDIFFTKTAVSQLQVKQDRLETSFTGFQIDFDKLRKPSNPPK